MGCCSMYFLRWMNPLVLRTMEAVSATSRVAYVHEKSIPENCAEVAQGASKKGRPKEYDLPHNTKLVYNDYHHQFKLSSTSAQTEKIKSNAFSHELKLTIDKDELLDPGKLLIPDEKDSTIIGTTYRASLSVIGVSSDTNSGPCARTYLEVKSLGKETMAPHSLKIATLVLPSQSPGDKTLLMTGSSNGIAPGVTLKKEVSFNIRGSKKCYNVMTYLGTEEELEHMAENTVSLHYQITITPTGE